MARDLKVYGMVISGSRADNLADAVQVSAIVAATTKAEAANLFGVSSGEFRNYASVTGNAEQVEIAMSKPGQVFARNANRYHGEYVEITRTPRTVTPRKPRVPFVMPQRAVRFTMEELEMIAGYFSAANSPVGKSICEKACTLMETNGSLDHLDKRW
jgi:hypothetical protein